MLGQALARLLARWCCSRCSGSAATSGAPWLVWKYLIAPMGGAWAIYELLPAFVVACIALVVVSLLTEAPEKEIVETYESVCAKKVKA